MELYFLRGKINQSYKLVSDLRLAKRFAAVGGKVQYVLLDTPEKCKAILKSIKENEINFSIEQKEKVIQTLAKKYKSGKISTIDGLRVNFEDWWFLVRLSNTESLLRLIVEAKTKKLLKLRLKELTRVIIS